MENHQSRKFVVIISLSRGTFKFRFTSTIVADYSYNEAEYRFCVLADKPYYNILKSAIYALLQKKVKTIKIMSMTEE